MANHSVRTVQNINVESKNMSFVSTRFTTLCKSHKIHFKSRVLEQEEVCSKRSKISKTSV